MSYYKKIATCQNNMALIKMKWHNSLTSHFMLWQEFAQYNETGLRGWELDIFTRVLWYISITWTFSLSQSLSLWTYCKQEMNNYYLWLYILYVIKAWYSSNEQAVAFFPYLWWVLRTLTHVTICLRISKCAIQVMEHRLCRTHRKLILQPSGMFQPKWERFFAGVGIIDCSI